MEKIDLNKYDYGLTKDKIAQFPLEDRAKSKLLVADANTKSIKHHIFYQLPELLPRNSHLFINSTKVIPARLNLSKKTGGRAEFLLLEPIKPSKEYETAMVSFSPVQWKCIVGGRKIKVSDILLNKNSICEEIDNFQAKIIEITNKEAIAEICWEPRNLPLAKVLAFFGRTPLPPYINREPVDKDAVSYQTIYAKYNGSVAAPTAGLHFTDEILLKIRRKGIDINEITLHVSAGTFLPIENDDVANHNMHSELFSVSFNSILDLLQSIKNEKNIIATGTTTLRTLESLYWLGVKLTKGFNLTEDIFIHQREPYIVAEKEKLISPANAFELLLEKMYKYSYEKIIGRTQLFIIPGYDFKIVSSLITNFHVPKSTLILLVSAFLGDDFLKQVYQEALDSNYRFLSYGDATFLQKKSVLP